MRPSQANAVWDLLAIAIFSSKLSSRPDPAAESRTGKTRCDNDAEMGGKQNRGERLRERSGGLKKG